MPVLSTLDWTSLIVGAALSGLVASVGGALWLRSSGIVVDWFSRRGELRGTWYGVLPAYENAPERVDVYRIRQRGGRLSGHVKRIKPHGRDGKWRIVGYVHGNVVVCVFHTTIPAVDASSYGVICVHREPNHGTATTYHGYYTRPDFEPYENFLDGSLSTRPFTWQRDHPDGKVASEPGGTQEP